MSERRLGPGPALLATDGDAHDLERACSLPAGRQNDGPVAKAIWQPDPGILPSFAHAGATTA